MVSFVLSRLDYCNALLVGLPEYLIHKLQVAQNYAARVVYRSPRFESAKPLLKKLHWLPVRRRIDYKIAVMCFRCIQGTAPTYLSELIQLNMPRRALRSSSDQNRLFIPRTNLVTYGDRSFAFAAPKVWNSLPEELRQSSNLDTFKRKLKTYLFSLEFV